MDSPGVSIFDGKFLTAERAKPLDGWFAANNISLSCNSGADLEIAYNEDSKGSVSRLMATVRVQHEGELRKDER